MSAHGIDIAPADGAAATARARALTPAELAWSAAIPWALLTVAAIVVLGPPLGELLFRPPSEPLWPPDWWNTRASPEPAKHGRYAVAMLAPFALAGAVLLAARRAPRLPPWAIGAIVLAGQAGLVAFAVVAVLAQRNAILVEAWWLPPIFSLRTLAVAAVLAAAAAIVLCRRRAIDRVAGLARERSWTRVACLAIAIAFTAAWLLEVPTTDGLVEDAGTMNWTPNGAYAVLDGRTPLVDVHLVYAKLLPYPTALVLATFGATTFVFTTFMAVLNLAALLAVFAVLRMIVGSVPALALFLPFVALSDVHHWMTLASIWPMRYLGPFVLAWLTARHIAGRSPRHAWTLFLVGGLATVDSLDFGLAALLATVAALLCARPPGSAGEVRRLAGAVAGGALGAVALVAAFTLVRAGELPRLDVLLEWPRIFTGLGWFSLPMPRAGLHLAIYATFAAAIAAAAVRVARRAGDALLTGMLAWSGVFGVVAGNYYVGRPDELKLVAMFSAWALALALLTIVSARALAAPGRRLPRPAELLALFAFALAVCTIGELPSPARQLERLAADTPAPRYRALAEPFVARSAERGEKVAILLPESYRIAYDLGLDNVAPYEMQNAIVTREQMARTIDVIEREGVEDVFTPTPGYYVIGDAEATVDQLQLLREAGFEPVDSLKSMIAWRRTS